jgi:hypothetical protein
MRGNLVASAAAYATLERVMCDQAGRRHGLSGAGAVVITEPGSGMRS